MKYNYVKGLMRAVEYFDKNPEAFVSGSLCIAVEDRPSYWATQSLLHLAIYLDGKEDGREYSERDFWSVFHLLPVEVQLAAGFSRAYPTRNEFVYTTSWKTVRPKAVRYLNLLKRKGS